MAKREESKEKKKMYVLDPKVANVFISGQKYTHKDKAKFAECKEVLDKVKKGFLIESK